MKKLKGKWRKGIRGRRRWHYVWKSFFLQGMTKQWRFSGEGWMDDSGLRLPGGNQAAGLLFLPPFWSHLPPPACWKRWVASLPLFLHLLPLNHPPLVWGQISSLQRRLETILLVFRFWILGWTVQKQLCKNDSSHQLADCFRLFFSSKWESKAFPGKKKINT